jgi:hypothetical protein
MRPADGVVYDHFVIYDTETAKAIAITRIVDLPEYYLWAALSFDGNLFAAEPRIT